MRGYVRLRAEEEEHELTLDYSGASNSDHSLGWGNAALGAAGSEQHHRIGISSGIINGLRAPRNEHLRSGQQEVTIIQHWRLLLRPFRLKRLGEFRCYTPLRSGPHLHQ